MGGPKKVTIGYWYGFGIHSGISRGPIDEFVSFVVDNKVAYKGSITSSGTVTINKPSLFGGEKKEGGIQGTMTVMMGESTQVPDALLDSMLGGGSPGFRGVVTMFFDGWVTALTPYPKPWKFRVRRALKGWQDSAVWYPSRAVIPIVVNSVSEPGPDTQDTTVKAMNGAHILYELFTNRGWGKGLPYSAIGASFTTAANTLFNEGFGLCFRWVRQDNVSSFAQMVLDHIGGLLRVNEVTGTIELVLIRNDYNPATVPHFDYSSGLLEINELETAAITGATNSVSVKYHDQVLDEERICAPVQNLGAVQVAGGTNATTQDYFGVPSDDLASRLAERDLQASMGTLRKLSLTFTYAAASLVPGTVFSISNARLGIDRLILRVVSQEKGSVTDGTINISAVEDVFGLPSASFVAPSNPEWNPPDRIPQNVATFRALEASYVEVVRSVDAANLQLIANTETYLSVLARSPQTFAMNYQLWTSANSTALANFTEAESGDWVPTGITQAVIAKTIAPITLTLSSLGIMDDVIVGSVVRINDEEFRLDNFNRATSQVTLARGCLDTVPQEHAAGSTVWFYQDYEALDLRSYLPGDRVYFKMLTATTQAVLPLASAVTQNLLMSGRQGRPYPPGNLRVNGIAYPVAINGNFNTALTWSHRHRVLQNDRIIDTSIGNFGPEEGVTYNLRIYDESGALRRNLTELNTTSSSYPYADEVADLNAFELAPTGVYELVGQMTYFERMMSLTPLAYWRFEETSGIVANDSSGNGYHGDILGGVTLNQPGLVPGSKSFKFNGTNGWVRVYPVAAALVDTSFSVQLLFKQDAAPVPGQLRMFFSINTSAGGNILLLYTGSAGEIRYDYSGFTTYSTVVPRVGDEHMLTFTHDFVTKVNTIYFNGVALPAPVTSTLSIASNSRVNIGQEWDTNNLSDFFSGMMDEVVIVNKVLTPAEIAASYATFRGPVGPRGNSRLRVELESDREGDLSIQRHNVTVERAGYGYNYGNFYGGAA